MKSIQTTFASFCLAAAMATFSVLALPKASHAQLAFVLQQSNQTAIPGGLLTYTGTLTNQGSDEIFLNGDTFSLAGTGLTVDDTPFFTNFPLSLASGEAFTDALFSVAVGPSATLGNYQGTFSIIGGATDTAATTLATQRFSVAVVPEPTTGLLLICGGTALGVVLRKRKAATK